MRYTTLYGKDDGLIVNLGSNVDIICAVIEVGISIDSIIYKVECTGKELIEFINKYNLKKIINSKLDLKKIKDNNLYKLTAYDW